MAGSGLFLDLAGASVAALELGGEDVSKILQKDAGTAAHQFHGRFLHLCGFHCGQFEWVDDLEDGIGNLRNYPAARWRVEDDPFPFCRCHSLSGRRTFCTALELAGSSGQESFDCAVTHPFFTAPPSGTGTCAQ